jgi:CRISPR/Cas system-associated exonuclease Cas4 (RecB family)
VVTSRLLEAFLSCPVKCHLLPKGEAPAGTEYSAWAAAKEESYRREGFRKLTSKEMGPDIASAEPGLWKHESWRFAIGKTVRTETWEAEIAMIQRITQAVAPSRFAPIRFTAKNRLTASDKTMAAFEALSLAEALGTKTGTAKIVHGEKQATFSVNAAALSRALHKKLSLVASLLSAASPPDTVLNRHCPECGFHDRCRKTADDKDDLSLLSRLRVLQLTMQHSLNRIFGFNLVRSTLNNLKIKASDRYSFAKKKILERIVGGLVQADETRANIKGHLAYVWVLTNMTEVVYVLAESREAEIVHDLLKDFKGVLVSDFYAAYESVPCPQQKCLIHLMRDLNDEILNTPFDTEMKSISTGFSGLLKPILETIERHGLKKRFLRKHLAEVDRFFGFLDATQFTSDAALKCKQRFEKNRDTLFTFLRYDGVPWNNNNAEHAIKAFARLRDVISGSSSRKGVDEYLTPLSVAETCEYRGIDFLDFLRSEDRDVDTFAKRRKRTRVHRRIPT